MGSDASDLEAARAAKSKALEVFKHIGPVSGVGISRRGGAYVVKVNLESEPDGAAQLPQHIDGVPVVIHIVGKIHKQ